MNLFQKIILASSIKDAETERIENLNRMVDIVTMYVNPQLYSAVHKKEDDYKRKNVDFERHSKVGRQTGKMVVAPQVMEAIRKANEMKKKMYNTESWRPKDPKKGPPIVG